MANKPFEIQGSTLSIGGVEINSSADGKIVVPGVTRATGYKIVDIKQLADFETTFAPDAHLDIADNFTFLDITDNGILDSTLGTVGPLMWTIDGEGKIEIEINEGNDYIYSEAQMNTAMSTNLWLTDVTNPTGQGGWTPSTDPADWYQIPFVPVFQAVGVESDLPSGGINFDEDGAINLQDPGTIRNTSGSANLVATDYAQLQWTTQTGAEDADPNGTQEPKNWVYVEAAGVYIETNINGQSGQSHGWSFGNDGNLQLPEGGDILDSNGNSVLGGSGSSPTVWVDQLYYDTTVNGAWSALTPMAVTSTEYDSNGNVIALVINYDNAGPGFTTVMKIDSQGVILAQTEFADSVELDGWGLAVDSSDNVYLCGQINNGVDIDMFVSKLDSDLQEVWSKKIDGGNNEYGYVIDCGGDGHPVVVGTASFDSNAIYTVKLDKDTGNILWQRYLNNGESSTDESAWGMAVGLYGEVVAVGTGGNNYRQLVVKYDNAGMLQWQKEIILDDGLSCYAGDAEIDNQGNIYVLGAYEWGSGQGISLTKLDGSGVAQWTRKVQGPCAAAAASIVFGDDGFLYISSTMGETVNDGFMGIKLNQVLAKYNADTGSVVWQRYFKHASEWAVSANFLSAYGAGSNLAVKNGRFALGTTRTLAYFAGNQSDNKAVLFQGATDGSEQTFGGFSFIASSLPGTLVSPFAVNNTNYSDNEGELAVSNWETGTEPGNISATLFGGGSTTNELTNGQYSITLNSDGRLSLPNLDSTGWNYNYNLNGPTLKLGVATDQVIITGPTPTQGNPSAQRVIIQGQRGYGNWGQNTAGEGGDVYIWGGTGGESDGGGGGGGDIKVRGGQGQNSDGGYVKIEGGSAAGWNNSPTGGYVEIRGGDAVEGGNGNGGDVRIFGGKKNGTGNNGEVYVSTGANEEFQWRFDNGGALNLATNNNISNITSAGSVILNADTKSWSFDTTGRLTLPPGGDITDSNGSSVLGAQGNPQALNTVKGWFQLQGNRPNDGDEVAFQTITTFGNYIYTAGLNYYAQTGWEDDSPVVQKINKNTGEVVWSKRIVAGRNAQFNFEIVGGVVNVVGLPNAGTGYKAGEQLLIPGYSLGGSQPQGNVYVQVDTVDQTGAITGYVVSQQPQIPGSDGTYNNVPVYNNNNNVQPYSIAYDLNGEQLVLACRTWRGAWSQENPWGYAYVDVYCLDDLTGAVNQSYTLKDLNDIEPTSVAVSSTGQIAVAGQKYNEYRSFGTLNILAPGNGYFDILKSNLDPEHYPNSGIPGDEAYNFFVQGTGIAYQEGVDNVNYYQNVATTVREGSGTVTVDVVCDGSGPYTYGAVTVQAGGTNYRVGHKIKYLGTQLGGATPANDLILTVTGIDGSGAITTATASGTAPSDGTIIGLTAGTNFEVGSGAQLNINISPVTGLITSIGTGNFGNYHYVVGDVLTVAGTTFANGASPANDITVTVTDVYLSGGPSAYSAPSGTVPSDALRIQVDGINFNTPGSWTMRQTLGGEAFIWTPTWNKAIGSSNNDWFNSVTFSPDGTYIYAVGSGQYEVNYQQALTVKFNSSTGEILWSKYVNSYLTPASEGSAEAMNAITLTDGKLIVSIGGQNNAENQRQEHGLVCLGSDGSLQWAKTYQEPNDSFDNECQVSRDSTNNLYLVYRGYSGNGNDAWTIVKINSTNGNIIWSRAVSNGNNSMYFQYNWSKDYAVVNGTDIFIAGHTYIPNDNYYSALLVKFPTDGFKTFDATGWDNGQQFGDLRVYEPVVEDFTQTQVPPTFTPTVHSGAVTTATNEKAFAAITDQYHPHTYLQYFTRDDLGYVQFGDGSKQSFATNIEPQVLGSSNQRLKLGPNDSGKHFFFDTNCGWGRIVIPSYDEDDSIPVGFKITIVNCSGGNIYVEALQPVNNNYYSAEIWGAGRNIRTREWGIPDSGSGSMVTLMKVKDAQYTGGENYSSPRWIISGPDDIYDSW